MNESAIAVKWTEKGYTAEYRTYLRRQMTFVLDERGKPKVFSSQVLAENAALKALIAEENRIDAIHNDPSQIKEAPRFWEVNTRQSRFKLAEQSLLRGMKRAMKENAL